MVLLTVDGIGPAPVSVDETEALPTEGRFTVSRGRYLERDSWPDDFRARAGVRLDPDEDVEALAPVLADSTLVVLTFTNMADGRPFSQARLLRRRIGYEGLLVASGPLVADQFEFLRRCGFDGVEIPPDAKPGVWLRALSRHRHHYQPDPAPQRAAPVAS